MRKWTIVLEFTDTGATEPTALTPDTIRELIGDAFYTEIPLSIVWNIVSIKDEGKV